MTTIIINTMNWSSWPDFAGSTWVPMQYLLGFQKLGIEAYWVDHLDKVDPHTCIHSLEYLIHKFGGTAQEFGFQDRYCILYNGDQRCFGLSKKEFEQLATETDLLVSISGNGLPRDSPLLHIPRRAYIDVDPGFTQIWAHQVDMGLDHHNFFFTVGQNVGGPGFKIPTLGIKWQPIFPPVVLELWPLQNDENCQRFSTVADWWGRQMVEFEGIFYGGKREEFLRFLRVPLESKQRIEVALTLSQQDHEQLRQLTENNWIVLDPYLYAGDPLSYREFIQFSRAEFSVAKSGYVKSNSGWISDRTVCYLASGKPVLIQSTGSEHYLPSGEGLLTFKDMEEAVLGFKTINDDYLKHSQAARKIAEQFFDSSRVLSSLLENVGI